MFLEPDYNNRTFKDFFRSVYILNVEAMHFSSNCAFTPNAIDIGTRVILQHGILGKSCSDNRSNIFKTLVCLL